MPARLPARLPAVALALLLAAPAPTLAQDAIRTQRVEFRTGSNTATVQATIRGEQTVDYLVRARKGQYLNVSLATKHGATYFNLMAPGETAVAFHIGSTSGNQYEGTVPRDGDLRIRVYMMRSAARRNESATYRLEIVVSGDARPAPAAAAGDAKVPGTSYHATGTIGCSMGGGQPTTRCPFGVRRAGNGSATVTVTKPDGRARTIYFAKGRATGSDASQADGGAFRASRESDLNIVQVGSERYEIPDAVISGG